MTLDQLNEQFDDKCALLMSEYMRGNIEFAEYDIEMTHLGEWYDKQLEEVTDDPNHS